MFHPVGPQPPTVYWRRRLIVLGSVVVLIVLLVMTLKVITSGGDGSAGAQGTQPSSPGPTSTANSPTTTPTTRSSSAASTTAGSSSSGRSTATSTPPPSCVAKKLAVSAVTGRTSYKVGDQPVLQLQVANTGTIPCVQDLADKQVELRVYNGESRVWGSHDCKIEAGTSPRTLTPNTPVRVAVTWSGLSSRPGCKGTRQRVGAGTYTLYAVLAGKTGKATQFSIG
jgi:hypothetical protein